MAFRSVISILLCLVSGFDAQLVVTNNIRASNENVWPYPQSIVTFDEYYTIDTANFQFLAKTQGECELLDKAIERYAKLSFIQDCSRVSQRGNTSLFTHKQELFTAPYKGQLFNISIDISNKCETTPNANQSEVYTLIVNEIGAVILAESVWGAMHAIETFSQLLRQIGVNQFAVNYTTVLDYPRFSHRGLMLDTARHYVPIHILLENLDAMVYNKLNVFHWHIVDDQSFPYVSKKFPDLSSKGAYNPKTHIYSPSDVANVIDYARQRGIRVLIEFDTPGHTLSWGKGQTDLLTQCYSGAQPNGEYGPIDPTLSSTYNFLLEFFVEVAQIFPEQYVHLGGDEVDFSCWQSNPNIANFMLKQNISGDYDKLEEYYIQNLLNIVKSVNKSYIVWQEVFDNNVVIKPDTIVHVWRDGWQKEMFEITNSGYHSLLSSCWYLNYISYGTDWPQYYQCDPQNFNGTARQNELVIGGEACMWGEWVDGTNLIARTWPRAIAVAERLWSSRELTDYKAASVRFDAQHCRLQQRGIKAEPANGPDFCQCDYAI